MRIDGVVFDLDGTLTDSMHIWNEAPKALVRRFGGAPPEDLAEQLKEMGRLEASEYMTKTFRLPCTPQEIMDGVNELVTRAYREQVPAKPGAAALLDRLKRDRHGQRGLSGPRRHGPAGAVGPLPVRFQRASVRLQDRTGALLCRRPQFGDGPGAYLGI